MNILNILSAIIGALIPIIYYRYWILPYRLFNNTVKEFCKKHMINIIKLTDGKYTVQFLHGSKYNNSVSKSIQYLDNDDNYPCIYSHITKFDTLLDAIKRLRKFINSRNEPLTSISKQDTIILGYDAVEKEKGTLLRSNTKELLKDTDQLELNQLISSMVQAHHNKQFELEEQLFTKIESKYGMKVSLDK